MKDGVERRLFVAATNQNDGKTTSSLGFVMGFSGIAKSVGFIKPVGQRYVITKDGSKIDEDAGLIYVACGMMAHHPKDMSPIARLLSQRHKNPGAPVTTSVAAFYYISRQSIGIFANSRY